MNYNRGKESLMTSDPFRVLLCLCLMSAAVTVTAGVVLARWMLG